MGHYSQQLVGLDQHKGWKQAVWTKDWVNKCAASLVFTAGNVPGWFGFCMNQTIVRIRDAGRWIIYLLLAKAASYTNNLLFCIWLVSMLLSKFQINTFHKMYNDFFIHSLSNSLKKWAQCESFFFFSFLIQLHKLCPDEYYTCLESWFKLQKRIYLYFKKSLILYMSSNVSVWKRELECV